MSIAQDIIDNARDSLADPNKERWSDARLLRLLDEGQKYVARLYSLLHGSSGILLSTDKAIYQLPSDLLFIKRCAYLQKPLPLYTYSEMDEREPDWTSKQGSTIEALVFNDRNLQEIRVYPVPDDDFPVEHYQFSSPFGVTTQIEGVTGDIFGVLTNLAANGSGDVTLTSVLGVATDGSYLEQLDMLYTRDPVTLSSSTNELELPPMFDRVLKLYVIGYAFSDDLDSKNQEKDRKSVV